MRHRLLKGWRNCQSATSAGDEISLSRRDWREPTQIWSFSPDEKNSHGNAEWIPPVNPDGSVFDPAAIQIFHWIKNSVRSLFSACLPDKGSARPPSTPGYWHRPGCWEGEGADPDQVGTAGESLLPACLLLQDRLVNASTDTRRRDASIWLGQIYCFQSVAEREEKGIGWLPRQSCMRPGLEPRCSRVGSSEKQHFSPFSMWLGDHVFGVETSVSTFISRRTPHCLLLIYQKESMRKHI